jgi:hypothetical protein
MFVQSNRPEPQLGDKHVYAVMVNDSQVCDATLMAKQVVCGLANFAAPPPQRKTTKKKKGGISLVSNFWYFSVKFVFFT